jgi:predicted Zn-dependent protease
MQLETSAPAMRVLAEVAERTNDRIALEWRRKILQLAPDSMADLIGLASCALQFNEIPEAEKTLASVSKEKAQTAPFEAIMARVAEAKNDTDAAEQHWTRATELDPQNKSYSLRLGLVKLKSETSAAQESGRVLLQELRSDQMQRTPATRALIADAVGRHEDAQKVRALARGLQDYREALFTDRIIYLDILWQLRDPEYTSYLTSMERDAVAKPADLAALFTWMNANQQSLVAIDFAKSLPENDVKAWPVPWSIAEAYNKVADWPDLEKLTKEGNWGQFDFVRRAYLARGLRAENKAVAAEREWEAAKSAAANHQSLTLLARIISEWKWRNEYVDLLWQLSKYPEAQKDALAALYQQYAQAEDALSLYRVLLRLVEVEPEDLNVQNNFAQVALLLHADVTRAHQVAADLFHKEPSNSAYASTYAFSLYEKRDLNGALRVMNTLREDQLNDPPVAAYYGIILAAAGDRDKARKYLEIGKKARLLEEEKALMERAKSALR